MKTKYKWIEFTYMQDMGWYCYNLSGEDELGYVEYDKGWRQFVFVRRDDVEIKFNWRCLEDIADFLKQLNKTKGCYKKKKG